MRQIILSMWVLCVCLWISSEANADNHRLWIEQSQEDGGNLKTWMVEKGLADEEGFSCKSLLGAAWIIADGRDIAQTVSVANAQESFTQFLSDWFFQANNLPCETLETRLTWVQFGEIGRQNDGYTPFNAEIVTEAKTAAESGLAEVQQAQTEVETGETVSVKPAKLPPPPPRVGPSTSQSTVASGPRYMPVMQDGRILSVEDVSPTPIPTQSEMVAWLEAKAKAEREAAEAAAREAAEIAERNAELERLRHEAEKKKLTEPLQTPVAMSGSHTEAFIRSYFHDFPEMVEIARCESGFENIQSQIVKGGVQEKSFSFFQIHEPTWHDDAVRLGLTKYKTDGMQNVIMARHVLETQGLDAWIGSKDCWGPRVRQYSRL